MTGARSKKLCARLTILAVGDIPVSTLSLIGKGISVHGWPSGHALDSEEAISFAENQGVKCMIEKFPFDQVEEAVKKMESGDVRFRSVLVME
jgi:D-arabinose 1-dehydrogenase-like Zn-dependent alcohol dehydrogenase